MACKSCFIQQEDTEAEKPKYQRDQDARRRPGVANAGPGQSDYAGGGTGGDDDYPTIGIGQNTNVDVSFGTYIQSKRASFSRRVPEGVCSYKNANISPAATAETGRFRSRSR